MDIQHISGADKGKVMLFALSTCVWCRKTKDLLTELGVGFDYIYVDLVPADEEDTVLDEFKKYNPDCNFPTLVINDSTIIIGFKESDIREALGS